MIEQLTAQEASLLQRVHKTYLVFFGSAQWLNDKLTPLSYLDIINFLMRGISQLIFINNPFAGAAMMAVIIFNYSYLGVMGLTGSVLTTLLAIYYKFPVTLLRNGVYGFGGALVGFALSTIVLRAADSEAALYIYSLFILPLAFLNIQIIKKVGFAFTEKTNLPFFTLPYNFTLFTFIPLFYLYTPKVLIQAVATETPLISAENIIEAMAVTVGEVFFVGGYVPSLLLLLIVLLFSPIVAVFSLLGASVFIFISLLINFDMVYSLNGIIGFNVLLTAVVIGSAIQSISIKALYMALIASVWSSGLSLLIATVFMPLGLPTLTLPFCLATISSLFVLKRAHPQIFIAQRYEHLSPEERYSLERAKY